MLDNKPDALNSLNYYLKQNEFWKKLADTITEVSLRLIDTPRWKLSRIRTSQWIRVGDTFTTPYGEGKITLISRNSPVKKSDGSYQYEDDIEIALNGEIVIRLPIRTMHDRSILIDNSRLLGFNFFSDHLLDTEYEKIQKFVSRYWPNAGRDDFVKFLGFIKGMYFEMHTLWTENIGNPDNNPSLDYYETLERLTQGEVKTWEKPGFLFTQINDNQDLGTVYPTSHVGLEFDIVETPEPNYESLTYLFYYMAPINLVLERFVSSVNSETAPTYYNKVASVDLYATASYVWQPNAELNLKYAPYNAVLDLHTFSYMHLKAVTFEEIQVNQP